MPVALEVGQDQVGIDLALQLLEELLHRRAEVRQETVAERLDDHARLARTRQERPRAGLGLAGAVAVGGQHDPGDA